MLRWSEFKTLLQEKLRYHGNSVISPGRTAADIEFGTAFDIRARLYLDMWCADVYAVPVDQSAFLTMDLSKREQNMQIRCANPIIEARQVWVSGVEIAKYSNYKDLQRDFDAVNTSAAQPYYWAPVRPGIIMFNCIPAAFYSSSYVQGYGTLPITSDDQFLELPSQTLDTLAEYESAHFISGTADNKPGLDALKMANAKAFEGARRIRGENMSYDFTGMRRGG